VNHHLTDATLRDFIAHRLPDGGLSAVDDHLSECGECRARAARLGVAGARLLELGTDLLAPESHLSDDEIQRYAGGTLPRSERAALDGHLATCAICAGEIEDLKRWASARSGFRAPMYVAAAAAVVLVLLGGFLLWRLLPDRPLVVEATLPGLDSLPADVQARVKAALSSGVAEPPESLTALIDPPEVLMGDVPPARFRLIEPLRTATLSDRPLFQWEALPGAEGYTIAVLDAELRPVAGQESVTDSRWTPPVPLPRDRAYVWQVTAHRGGESVTVPAPPSPMARFRVADERAAETIQDLSRVEPESHLLLGILCAQSGARSEAEFHLRQVPSTDPNAEVARRTLEALRSVPPR
jgi:hypothetical protein